MNVMEGMIRERDEYLNKKESEFEILRVRISDFEYFQSKKIVKILKAFRVL